VACTRPAHAVVQSRLPFVTAGRGWRARTPLAAASQSLPATEEKEKPVGASVGDAAYSALSNVAKAINPDMTLDERRVGISINRLERDMELLDQDAANTPQLSDQELFVLLSTVAVAAFCPFFASTKIVEVLVPSMSALSAAVGISAEYTGRVAVSRGKEVAAVTLQCAAEAEMLLAQAERAKAIVPLCVGIATTASAFALLAPALLEEIVPRFGLQIITEVYLICPFFAVIAAAVAALASQEAIGLTSSAIGTGTRRFASSSEVGRTWLSATEQIVESSKRSQSKWLNFGIGVLPAPLIGVLCPGQLAFKAIVVAAVAAAQCAYQLAQAEYAIAEGLEAVSNKARSGAIADTYANQGARAGAILPFTSALSGLCAATTVAVVEGLPLITALPLQAAVAVVFPAIGATIAAAASISKARCEVDAAAANAAATQLQFAVPLGSKGKGPIGNVVELIRLTWKTQVRQLPGFLQRSIGRFFTKISEFAALMAKWFGGYPGGGSDKRATA